jgi:uncharacterized membrane-anchored protein
MIESSDQPSSKPEKTWLSSFMLVLGALSLIAAVMALLTRGFGVGLFGLAIAAAFLALGRALDLLREILFRLDRLQTKDAKR